MINYWQQNEENKIEKVKLSEMDATKRTWVDARIVTREDVELLQNVYDIDPEHILDILDPDEQSRLEDADDYLLTILRLPIFDPQAETQYFTCPLGIIIKENFIITICWTDCEVLKDFAAGRVKEITLNDFPAFIMRILSRADTTFLRYLKAINRRSTAIQNELQLSIENKEILLLLSLEKSLVFFTTSLKSNQMLLEKFRKTKIIKLDLDDIDWLDDVEIDNRQAIEMADTYRNVLLGITDAFDSVINNNLNMYMKRLSILNIIMMVPTFITSWYGMNVPLPLENKGKLAALIISGICFASIFITWFFLGIAERRFPNSNKKANANKQIRQTKEKKNDRRMKSIEKALQE
ncbi:MAG: magnesium transporter CorA family protein [Treponema sp.]|nr:magnesium transporter CorA family protein [Treponema sp.]